MKMKSCIRFAAAATLNYPDVLLGPPNTINFKTAVLNIEARPMPHLAVANRATNHM